MRREEVAADGGRMLHANLARRTRKSVGAALNASRLCFYRFSGSLFSLPVGRFDILFRRGLPRRKGTFDVGCRTLWSLHRIEKAGGFSGGVSPVLREERENVGCLVCLGLNCIPG